MNSNLIIKRYHYSKEGLDEIFSFKYGKNWPHVYLIHDDKKLYIGETQSLRQRTSEHLSSDDVEVEKRKAVIDAICDDSLNKSAILDIEQSLIKLFNADGSYKLLNSQKGQSVLHNYYQKDYYHNELVEKIWDELVNRKIAKKPLILLKNLDIFKYSPFVSLTEEQLDVCEDIIIHMANTIPNHTGTYIVNGSAGTGKTVLAIYLLGILKDLINNMPNNSNMEDYDDLMSSFNVTKSLLGNVLKQKGINKIGFVVPMTSLRNTLKSVFKNSGLSIVNVIGPDDAVKNDYDILFVDEAHRLFHRKNLTSYGTFDDKSKILGLDPKKANQLQWIMLKSKYTVLFYDSIQSVKKSDITVSEYEEAIKMHNSVKSSTLTSQLRCAGGEDYVKYVDDILHGKATSKLSFSKNYEVLVFDHIKDMIDIIKEKEVDYGLCRLIAGYGWFWKTKDKKYEDIISSGEYDIDIEGTHLIWNTTADRWIYSKHAIDEVGCIHTTQGFDLNYAGIIFGPEIDYDPIKKEIIINPNKFYDKKVKAGATPSELKQFIINSYGVMLKRGIKGTYIYAVNDNLRNYLKQFFDLYSPQQSN